MPGNTNKLRFRWQRDILPALFVLLFLPAANAQVQVYPVSVTTQLTPPYSVNLADYTAPGSSQLKVIIVQRDLTQAPYRLFLKMNIELNGRTIIRSAPLYVPPPLTLDPGIPTVFSGTDLSPFFDPENMDFVGYSRDAYMRSKLLPEGAYVISFTAYDWTRRDVALSNGGSFFCYLAKADPPLLNLPVNNAVVPLSTPQYINFQWLSRTASSPNSANSTRYRFELFEMRVGGISPGEIVQSSRPVFTAETDRTSLIYSIAEPSLEKGMRYVWRVKASDVQGRDYIRNNGLSEVFSFIYGGEGRGIIDFGSIGNFIARAVTPKKAALSWDPSDYDSYKIFYRKKGDENKWYESETIQNEAELKGLSPGTVYECKVQGKKGSVWGNVSDVDTVSMPLPAVIECGSPFTPLAVSNNEPLAELLRLQQFDAGGFVVTLTDPYAISIKPGVFSGKGFVEVPLFGHKKIRCEFRDIFINTDYQMVRGQVQLITDNSVDGDNAIWSIDDVFEGGTDNGTVRSGTEEASVILPEIIIDDPEDIVLDIAGKEILVINESSDTVHIDVSEKLAENPGSLTVKDSGGNLYSVDTKTGKSTSLGKAPAAGSSQQIATIPSILDNRKGIVSFGVIPGKTRFAYDKRDSKYARSNLFNEEYRTIKMNDGSLYDVPFKLIPAGETDVISAKVEIKGKKISPDSVVFRSGTGTIYKPVKVSMDDNGRNAEYHLTLPSGKDNDGIEVYATYTDSKRQTFVLGKMIVMSYSVKKPKLTLVPVNGNGINTDINVIKKELDRIYLPVAVDWQVSLDEDFNVTVDSLRISGSGLFSTYTDEMKQLNSAFIFHKAERFDPSTIYLFMLQFSENQSATGDMPRGNQFGYIFSRTAGADEAIYRTIAHEIAHGTFSLKHTFDSQYQLPRGTTSNLLDYTSGTDLVKHQWDAIHDPGLVIGIFERDEDGMSVNCFAPKPSTPGTMEGQRQVVKHRTTTAGLASVSQECTEVFYYHIEEKPYNSCCDENGRELVVQSKYKTDWYPEKQYCKDIIKPVLLSFGIINEHVRVLSTNLDSRKISAVYNLEQFFKDRPVSDDILKTLETSYYSEICKDATNRLAGSGRADPVNIEFDIVLAFTGVGEARALLNYLKAKNFLQGAKLFASRTNKGIEILATDGGEKVALYADGVLKEINYIDEGGEILYNTGKIKLIEKDGSKVESVLQIVRKDGQIGFRKTTVITDAFHLAEEGNWKTIIGKNIDELDEAPTGYQYYIKNEQKFIRRINASNPNTPQLTVRYGKIVHATGKIVTNVDEIKLLLKTDANKAFFWSGRTDGVGGKNKALEIAKSKGGTTLEGLIDDYKINMPEWNETDATAIKIWEDVSATYANQASGEVRAVVGTNLRSGNVWENIELPRLKANQNITKITLIDPKTLQETIVWTK